MFVVCCIILETKHVKVNTIIIYDIDTRENFSLNTLNDVQTVYNNLSINVCVCLSRLKVSVLHIIIIIVCILLP